MTANSTTPIQVDLNEGFALGFILQMREQRYDLATIASLKSTESGFYFKIAQTKNNELIITFEDQDKQTIHSSKVNIQNYLNDFSMLLVSFKKIDHKIETNLVINQSSLLQETFTGNFPEKFSDGDMSIGRGSQKECEAGMVMYELFVFAKAEKIFNPKVYQYAKSKYPIGGAKK